MLKRLLATTAIVALATSSALAANSAPAKKMDTTAATAANMDATTAAMSQHLASKLIGENVYASTKADADTVGQINDLVVTSDGTITNVVIGVGGFIGIGEKNVAVPFDRLKWSRHEDGKVYAVLETTKDQLKQASAFDMSRFEPKPPANMNAQNNTAVAPAPETTPGIATPAKPDQMAAAPKSDKLRSVKASTISADKLMNVAVYSADNKDVGEISDVILTKDGKIDAVVIDVGGFLGIGAKPVAIAFDALNIRKDENGTLYAFTVLTEDELNTATEYNADTYAENRDSMRLATPQ